MISPAAIIATIKINLLSHPLWRLEMACDVLDIQMRKLSELIQTGVLPWVFNIGTGKREGNMRVLGHCVIERQLGTIREIGATKNLKLPEVVSLCVPVQRQAIRGTELQKWWSCRPDTIQKLRDARLIETVLGERAGSGPNGSPRLVTESVKGFLAKRRVL